MSKVVQQVSAVNVQTVEIYEFDPECNKSVTIEGIPHRNGERFDINLVDGDEETPYILFQISVRYKKNEIVLIAILNERWAAEQKFDHISIAAGNFFRIVITHAQYEFNVDVNGTMNYTLSKKPNFLRVTHVEIKGDVTLEAVQIEQLIFS